MCREKKRFSDRPKAEALAGMKNAECADTLIYLEWEYMLKLGKIKQCAISGSTSTLRLVILLSPHARWD